VRGVTFAASGKDTRYSLDLIRFRGHLSNALLAVLDGNVDECETDASVTSGTDDRGTGERPMTFARTLCGELVAIDPALIDGFASRLDHRQRPRRRLHLQPTWKDWD
jgi:hypothetical protein